MQGVPDSGSWFHQGNRETTESRKKARGHRHGSIIKVTFRDVGGEPAGEPGGLRLGTRKTRGGKASGLAPPRGRAREFRLGERVTTCCRGGDRVILLSERVQGGTETNRQTGKVRG